MLLVLWHFAKDIIWLHNARLISDVFKRQRPSENSNFPFLGRLFGFVISSHIHRQTTWWQLVGYAKRSVKLALSWCVCAFMRTLPLAGNRRASIRFKSGASNSHASTRIPRNTCTLVEGKRVHTTRQRLVKHDDGAWTLYTNRKFNKGSSTGTVHHCEWIRVQHLGNLIV